jgi:hypothetical protein
MKGLLPLISQAILILLFSGFLRAQDDDSMRVVIPSTENASLNILIPPAGFEVSTAFNGYISMPNSSAIIMTQINNANYLKIAEGMTDEWYVENRLTFISSGDVKSDFGVKGKFFKSSFELQADTWIRYMVYVGDLEKTIWLSITYPSKLEELIEGEILKCLQTIDLNRVSDEK